MACLRRVARLKDYRGLRSAGVPSHKAVRLGGRMFVEETGHDVHKDSVDIALADATRDTEDMHLTPADLKHIAVRTLAHYDQHAQSYWDGTRDHDVSQNIATLLKYIE